MTDEFLLKLVEIRPIPGCKIEKRPDRIYLSRCRYSFPVIYVLDDGQEVPTVITHALLRDCKADLASLPRPPRNTTHVQLKDGEVWMTRHTFGLGRP